MYTNCTSSGSKLYNNKSCCGAYGFSTPFGQRALDVYGQFLYKSRTLWGTFLHSTYACGTVCPNRRSLPKAVITAKLRKTEAVFRCSGPLLAIKWCDKRAVILLTAIHAAVHVETNKTDAQGNQILKPLGIVSYTKKMGGCDTSDQLISYYSFLWKSVKWWKKLCIHLLNMLLQNAHILNSKYDCIKLYHQGYMEYMANYLITEGSVNCSLKRPLVQCHSAQNVTQGTVAMPMDLHLPQLIPRTDGSKRKLSRPCFACNGSWSHIWAKRIPKRCTGIWCGTCKKPVCIAPCFDIFHTDENYTGMGKEICNIESSFQRANELGSHRLILSDTTLKNFSWCNAMQQITKLQPLLHLIM